MMESNNDTVDVIDSRTSGVTFARGGERHGSLVLLIIKIVKELYTCLRQYQFFEVQN